jgi:predicted GNAT family acetyltransferase
MPTETVTTETTTQLPPLPTFTEALRNPSQIVARRGEFVKLASDRAQQAAAVARTRLQNVETVAAARVQDLRKSTDALVTTTVAGLRKMSVPAQVRNAVFQALQRAAQALQTLAKRVEPKAEATVEAPAPKDVQ